MITQAEKIIINGKELKCLVCQHDEFWEREAQLNTATATFFGFDFANPTGRCVICDDCGYIHWFFPKN